MKIEGMVEEFRGRLEHTRKRQPYLRSKELFTQMKLNYFERLLRAQQEGEPIVWVVWSIPSEIFLAMDIATFIPEQYCLQMSTVDQGLEFVDLAQAEGMAPEICGAFLCLYGGAVAREFVPPAAIIGSSVPCDSALSVFASARNFYGCPGYELHAALWTGDRDRDRASIEYYKRQLQGKIHFLEELTGKKMDYDKLQEMVERSMKAHSYLVRIQQELRKAVPTPITGREGIASFGILFQFWGTQEVLEYCQTLYKETKARVERGEAPLAEEEHRICWLGAYPYYDMKLLDRIKVEHHTEIPLDFNNFLFEYPIEDTSDPLRAVAQRTLGMPAVRFVYPYSSLRHEFLTQVREFQVEGVIYYLHFGCANTAGISAPMREDLKAMGIPTLVVDGAPMDRRVVPVEEQWRKIDDFLTTVIK